MASFLKTINRTREKIVKVLHDEGQTITRTRKAYVANGTTIPESTTTFRGLKDILQKRRSPMWDEVGMLASGGSDEQTLMLDWKADIRELDTLTFDGMVYEATRVHPINRNDYVVAYIVFLTRIGAA